MPSLLHLHLLEHLRRRRIGFAQAVGEISVDAAVFFLHADRQRQDFAFAQVFEVLFGHGSEYPPCRRQSDGLYPRNGANCAVSDGHRRTSLGEEMPENIGFIGLGNMGEPMAANLLAAGFAVRVYNRTISKSSALQSKGAVVATTAADAVVPGGIVFTMLSDDRALEEICAARPSFVERLGRGGVHVS